MLSCLPSYLCIYAAQCSTIFDFYWSWSSRRVVSQNGASNSTMHIHDFFYFSGARCTLFSFYLVTSYQTTGNVLITVFVTVFDIEHLLKCILVCINDDTMKWNEMKKSYHFCLSIFVNLCFIPLVVTNCTGASDRSFYPFLTKGLTTLKHFWQWTDPKMLVSYVTVRTFNVQPQSRSTKRTFILPQKCLASDLNMLS